MAVPNTQSVTTRGMKIVVNGATVGLIQNFTLSQARTVQRVFEINADSNGDAVEIVPGNLDDLSIQIDRVELYARALENYFGIADAAMLTNQTEPFELHEVYFKPDGTSYGYKYEGCWFTNTGRTCPAEGARLVTRNATIQASRIREF